MGTLVPTQVNQDTRPYYGLAALTGALLLWPLVGCHKSPVTDGEVASGNTIPTPLPGDPQAAVQALVKTSHGILAGEQRMASALLHLRRSKDDDLPEQVILWTQNRMRLVRRNRQIDIRLPQGAWRVTPHTSAIEHTGQKLQNLDKLQDLLRSALLKPLYQASDVKQTAPTVYDLSNANGVSWKLEVRSFKPLQGDAVFLPWKLTGPSGQIIWHDYLHTGITHLPRRVTLGALGERFVSLEASQLTLDENWFTDPLNPSYVTPGTDELVLHNESLSLDRTADKPRIGYTRASRSVVLEDPGTWEERVTLTNQEARRLYKQGQEGDDLDFLFESEGVSYYAIPFIIRDGNGKPFVPEQNQRVLRIPRQRVVILRTKPRHLREARKFADETLKQFVSKNQLDVIGPLRTRPFIEMDQLIKGRLSVGKIEVQFELPIR